jgi:hypothetical protein
MAISRRKVLQKEDLEGARLTVKLRDSALSGWKRTRYELDLLSAAIGIERAPAVAFGGIPDGIKATASGETRRNKSLSSREMIEWE